MTLRCERLDLARLVHDCAEAARGMLEAAGLTLFTELPETAVWVQGDRTRLAQAVGNLLDNAARFTEPGGRVTVRLAAHPEDRLAAIVVRDTGAGIEPEVLACLFQPFAQAAQALDRSGGEMGPGLAFVKGLVERHGGEVRAYSEGTGRGTEVTLLLPLAPVASASIPMHGAAPSGSLRLLIVEDNEDAAETLRDLLELSGCTVATVHSGTEALPAALAFRPEVVLCDLGLPGLNGYQVAAALRREPSLVATRLIAISGYGQAEDQRRSREVGFDLHLIKPVDPAELQRLLELTPECDRDRR